MTEPRIAENTFWKQPTIQILLIIIIVFLSRLPFLSAGYALDVDGWRLAAVARNISVTGQYGYSRVPGHPVQEIICSFFWKGGPVILNGLTAFISSLAALFFALILRKTGSKNIYLPVFAFAFTPIIFINSTNSMDYVWALAFILGSMYFVMIKKPLIAGIFLGMATGCRLTSGLMLIPLIMMLYYNESSNQKIKNIFYFALSTGFVTIILFAPIYLRYGLDLFKYFKGEYPRIIYIVFRIAIAIWGFIGTVTIFATLLIQIYKFKLKGSRTDYQLHAGKYYSMSLITALTLFSLAFSALPHEAGYLITIVPLILILLGRFLHRSLFNIVCLSLIISPFLLSVNRVDSYLVPNFSQYSLKFNLSGSYIVLDFLKGPIISDHLKRLEQVDYANEIIAEGKAITHKSVIVIGDFYPLIDVTLPYNVQGNVIYEYLLDSLKLKQYTGEGYNIYYLPDVEKTNLDVYNINLNDYGGRPFVRKQN